MQVKKSVSNKAILEGYAWMNISNPDLSVEEAVEKLKALGNPILEVDVEGRRIKVMHEEGIEVWVCDKCKAYSRDKEKVEEHEKNCNYKKEIN